MNKLGISINPENYKLIPAYAAGDIPVAIENLPRTCIGRTSEEVVFLSESCSGICFDVNHLLMQSHESFLDQAEKHIIATHLSDCDGINERHWMPSAGIVPWKRASGLQNPI